MIGLIASISLLIYLKTSETADTSDPQNLKNITESNIDSSIETLRDEFFDGLSGDNFTKARELLDEAEASGDLSDDDIAIWEAYYYQATGDPYMAVTYMNRLVSVDLNPECLALMADLLRSLCRYDEAIEYYDRLLTFVNSGYEPSALYFAWHAAIGMYDLELAAHYADRLLSEWPESDYALHFLFDEACYSNDVEAMVESYETLRDRFSADSSFTRDDLNQVCGYHEAVIAFAERDPDQVPEILMQYDYYESNPFQSLLWLIHLELLHNRFDNALQAAIGGVMNTCEAYDLDSIRYDIPDELSDAEMMYGVPFPSYGAQFFANAAFSELCRGNIVWARQLAGQARIHADYIARPRIIKMIAYMCENDLYTAMIHIRSGMNANPYDMDLKLCYLLLARIDSSLEQSSYPEYSVFLNEVLETTRDFHMAYPDNPETMYHYGMACLISGDLENASVLLDLFEANGRVQAYITDPAAYIALTEGSNAAYEFMHTIDLYPSFVILCDLLIYAAVFQSEEILDVVMRMEPELNPVGEFDRELRSLYDLARARIDGEYVPQGKV